MSVADLRRVRGRIAETYVTTLPGGSTWRDAIAFILLILILIFRPGGIMGRATDLARE